MKNRLILAGLSLLLLSMTGQAGTPTGSVQNDGASKADFSLSLSSSTLTLAPSQGGTIGITLGEKCKEMVTFSATGFPAGVGFSFIPTSSTTGSTLVVYASSTAAPGSYSVTVAGSHGSSTVSAPLTLVVSGPAQANFTVTAPAASLTLARGTGTTVPITVSPGPGFTGTVTFGLTGLPAGVSVAFLPASSTTGSTLVIYASSSTAVGTYNVALTGTSQGTLSSVPGTLIIQ